MCHLCANSTSYCLVFLGSKRIYQQVREHILPAQQFNLASLPGLIDSAPRALFRLIALSPWLIFLFPSLAPSPALHRGWSSLISRTRGQQLHNEQCKTRIRPPPSIPRFPPLPLSPSAIPMYVVVENLFHQPIKFVKISQTRVWKCFYFTADCVYLPSVMNTSVPRSGAFYTYPYPATNDVYFRSVQDATKPEGQGKGTEEGKVLSSMIFCISRTTDGS